MKQRQFFTLLGSPVSHSLSPRMMNAAFKHLKINAVYKAIDCKKSKLAGLIKKIRSGEIAGANVTMPHKETVIQYLDKLTPAAKKIGAVNTIYRRGKMVVGDNTDGKGFIASLFDVGAYGIRPKLRAYSRTPLRPKRIIVIGSGGAAKAICHALIDTGISSLTILNRHQKHSQQLISDLKKNGYQQPFTLHFSPFTQNWNAHDLNQCDLLINATPLGSRGAPWPSLNFVKHLPKNTIVFDIVTHPTETALIKAAKKLRLKVIFGREMLLHQGALAFELWTGKKAPIRMMRKDLKQNLSISV